MKDKDLSRRGFLRQIGVGTIGLAAGSFARDLIAAEPAGNITKLTRNLFVYHGHINIGILRDGKKALLIDCGDGSVIAALPDLGIESINQAVFTHHHRDQACGAYKLVEKGARIGVPDSEQSYFDKVSDFWNEPKYRWHLYDFHPHHLMLAESVKVDTAYKDGDTFKWGKAKISVIATPGHTDGSISYLVEVDGKKVIFSGDVIADEGKVWDIHSLQKGGTLMGKSYWDYHCFLGARTSLIAGLARVRKAGPDTLVPSHGKVMANPSKAIDTLVERLEVCYDKYVSITSLRHYFPEMFTNYASRKDHMAFKEGFAPPDCLRQFGNSWVIISKDKAAFIIDCGNKGIIAEIKKLLEQGQISAVEGLWVTHYHDDHVNAIPEFQKTFDCPCITDRAVARVITDPLAWRLPCISPSKVRVDRVTKDGESWQWHEFKMTAYYFPGQTLYHSGLLVESGGLRVFLAGDSFSRSGIDDYCAGNRNWLGKGVGFNHCIDLLEKLKPTHIINCHIKDAFNFTPEQFHFMKANLAEREKLFGKLFLWDHANYGMDEPWVRCYPYEQQAKPSSDVKLSVVVTNHSRRVHPAKCRAVLPRSWGDGGGTTEWVEGNIPAKTEGEIVLSMHIPGGVAPGRYVIPIDIRYDRWDLPQFTEGIVVVR